MKRPLTMLGVIILLCNGGESLAQTRSVKSVGHVREIYACMVRRMSADKGLSYNDAMKACKNPVAPPATESASNTDPPPVVKAP